CSPPAGLARPGCRCGCSIRPPSMCCSCAHDVPLEYAFTCGTGRCATGAVGCPARWAQSLCQPCLSGRAGAARLPAPGLGLATAAPDAVARRYACGRGTGLSEVQLE